MTKKFVITTVQPIIRRYYVEVDNPEWAWDGIVMNEMEEYSQTYGSEDIISTQQFEKFPEPGLGESVNAAVMRFNDESNQWDCEAVWELPK